MLTIRNHWLAGPAVAQRRTPNIGGPLTPRYLVLHYTAGRSAASAVDSLCTRKPSGNASAHIVLARDGAITQLAPFNVVTWHAGISEWMGLVGLNQYAIGIEMDNAGCLTEVGGSYNAWFGKSYPASEVVLAAPKQGGLVRPWHAYTEAQIARCVELSELLVATYRLKDVLGHEDIAPGRKQDPGPAFPLASLATRVLGRGDDEPARLAVTVDGLNIRSGPGVEHPIVAAPLARGTVLRLVEPGARWSHVIAEGAVDVEGWVATSYVAPQARTRSRAAAGAGAAPTSAPRPTMVELDAAPLGATRSGPGSAVLAYVQRLDLPPEPARPPTKRRSRGAGAAAAASATPAAAKTVFGSEPQLVAVGANLAEFGPGMSSSQRAAVADCLLLAQLSATKVTPPEAGPMGWYRQYFSVLQALGWMPSSMVFQDQTVNDIDGSMHEAILPVLSTLLGPAVAASSLALGVLKGLKEMNTETPWITLFNRSSAQTHGAAFQIGIADASDEGVTLRMAAVAIDAERSLTQVLFFKFAQSRATLTVADGILSMPADRLRQNAPAIAARVAPYLLERIAQVPL